jgi:hypothetical protein
VKTEEDKAHIPDPQPETTVVKNLRERNKHLAHIVETVQEENTVLHCRMGGYECDIARLKDEKAQLEAKLESSLCDTCGRWKEKYEGLKQSTFELNETLVRDRQRLDKDTKAQEKQMEGLMQDNKKKDARITQLEALLKQHGIEVPA